VLLKAHAAAHGAAIDVDQVFADPASGRVVGTRRSGVYLWWRKRRARRG